MIVVLMVTSLFVAAPVASADTFMATIDFESGLSEGDIAGTLDVGAGISGTDFGSVSVVGTNPALTPTTNWAMVFDATCDGGCSGGDTDLEQPANGNVLIISEDKDADDPDDADVVGARFDFDFSAWGSGTVTVISMDVLDVELEEGGANISFDVGADVPIPTIGDGNIETVAVNRAGVSEMTVLLNGSGAIDNVKISIERGGEGCTPGYYKNLRKHGGSWVDYEPSQSFADVFGVPYDHTLIQALRGRGGHEIALGRHAVAALLNASNGDVDYLYTTDQVIAMVQAAWASGHYTRTKNMLAAQNQLGCPVGNTGPFVSGG